MGRFLAGVGASLLAGGVMLYLAEPVTNARTGEAVPRWRGLVRLLRYRDP